MIDGEGSGECGRQTIVLRLIIKMALETGAYYTLPGSDVSTLLFFLAYYVLALTRSQGYPAVHVYDLADFYLLLIQRILSNNTPPVGYWFPISYSLTISDIDDTLPKALHSLGLIKSPEVKIWEDDKAAADALGLPEMFIPLIYHNQ